MPVQPKSTQTANANMLAGNRLNFLFKTMRGLAANLLFEEAGFEAAKTQPVFPNMACNEMTSRWHKTTYKQAKKRYTAVKNSEAPFLN